MRFLILSDIHANWEALQAVLRDASGRYDRIVCCGDVVGYGADPDAVTEWVRGHVSHIIRGNHDKACAGLEDLEWFNPVARQSARWTLGVLRASNSEYLRGLQKGPEAVNGFQIFHGSPADEDEYLLSAQDAAQILPYLEVPVSFFGHTHLQGGFLCRPHRLRRLPPAFDGKAELELEPDSFYLINPGSVGQPRDGDPRAAYAVYDPEQRLVIYYRVAYELERAQEKILAAGLPDTLALRLASGT